jgi:hypothetical protein
MQIGRRDRVCRFISPRCRLGPPRQGRMGGVLNDIRRHLDRNERRALIEAALKENPARSNRQIGTKLGVPDNTVGATRKEMEDAGD